MKLIGEGREYDGREERRMGGRASMLGYLGLTLMVIFTITYYPCIQKASPQPIQLEDWLDPKTILKLDILRQSMCKHTSLRSISPLHLKLTIDYRKETVITI